MSKIEVDKGLCIACGSCISACPECFEFGDDGKAQVVKEPKADCCDLKEIVDNCPVQAISVE